MAQEQKDTRVSIKGDKAREELLEGAQFMYDNVSVSFGPKGRNLLIEKPFGRPVLTRDGVSIAREVYLKDRSKNMGCQLLLEASETTNRVAGDGTSGTVVLGYQLLNHGIKAIAAGQHPMQVKTQLIEDSQILLDELETLSRPVKKDQLEEVATVSAGDPLLGKLIGDAIAKVGPDGGIITEKAPIDSVECEYIDGYYLQQGFEALQAGKKELIDPSVIVTKRRLSSAQDAAEILTKTAQMKGLQPTDVLRVVLIGNIEDAAYYTIVNLINQGRIDAVILKTPPNFGNMGERLLEDIAIYASCEPITDSTNIKEFNEKYVGTIDKVVASKTESTLFCDNSGETIRDRVKELKEELKTEVSDAVSEKMRDRIAKLEGKIALFRIGGATDTEREELEFRVEDAIQATRAANAEGVVAGGGVTWLELSKLPISDIYKNALQDTFKKLLSNADLAVDLKFDEAMKAEKGFGFNLRIDDELVDMVKNGVIDPTLVAKEVIRNSTSVSANALTTDVLLIFTDRKDD